MTIDRDAALTEPVRRAGWVSAVPSARAHLRFAHRLEAWGAKLAFAIFGWFSLDWASAIGGALGRAIGPRLDISRRARLNLSRVWPALTDVEISRIIAGMWDNLGRVAAEYPHLREIRVFDPTGRLPRAAA